METLQGCLNTLYYCRENESCRTQDEQSDLLVKDVRRDWKKNYSGGTLHSVFPRWRALWKGQDCVSRAAVWCLEILESLRFPVGKQPLNLSPQLQSLENTLCVDTGIKVLHLLLISKEGQVFSCGTCANLSQGSCFWTQLLRHDTISALSHQNGWKCLLN